MKIESTALRLKEIMAESNLRQIDVIEKCQPYCSKYGIKMGRNDLSQYLSGKFQPKQTKLTVLALALGVNEAWLMGYDVPKARFDTPAPTLPALSEEDEAMLNTYLELSDDSKRVVRYTVNMYAKSESQSESTKKWNA